MKRLIPGRWRARREPGRTMQYQEGGGQLLGLRDDISRLFEDFFGDAPGLHAWPDAGKQALFQPRIDVSETEKAVNVIAELPGMDEKDVEVCLERGVLSIRGEKKQEQQHKDTHFHYVERRSGRFYREIALPSLIDSDKAQAVFRKGVLTVSVPKTKGTEKACRVIPVTTA